MSGLDDVLDSEIRGTLLRTPVGDADAARALPQVLATARARRHRRRAAGVVGSLTVVGLLAATIGTIGGDETVVTDAPPSSITSAPPPEYGFAPLTPLLDDPLPIIAPTELLVVNGHVMFAESAPGKLIVGLTDATGASSSFSGDPEAAPALILSTASFDSTGAEPRNFVQGVTRAEVARVDWIRPSGIVSVRTIENDAFPQLRFFLIEDPDASITRGSSPFLAAYSEDGTLLADYRRLAAEQR